MKRRRRVAGLHAAESVLHHGAERIITVWVDERRASEGRLAKLIQELSVTGIRVQRAGRGRLDEMADGQKHQGIVMEVLEGKELGETDLDDATREREQEQEQEQEQCPFFLVLDQIQDPHNLGACLRTADAAGVHGVVVTRDRSADLTPVVSKIASGAAETVPLYRVTNLVRTLEFLKNRGLWIVGASGSTGKTAFEADLTVPLALVVGAEGRGLRRLTEDHCDYLIRLPMLGTVESLNLSVAAGILMYETLRQRLAATVANQ